MVILDFKMLRKEILLLCFMRRVLPVVTLSRQFKDNEPAELTLCQGICGRKLILEQRTFDDGAVWRERKEWRA